MFRPSAGAASAGAASKLASPSKQQQQQSNADNNNSPTATTTTIREIRSRTLASTTSTASNNNNNNNAANRQNLLAQRRQAMSMEKLSGSSSSVASTVQSGCNDKEKSPTGGSSNSINSSPSRSGGLNRTASRVSRFRSAKAVFERLSSANSNPKLDTAGGKPMVGGENKSRGTVASRYAAAAAARATTHSQATSSSSPRSRLLAGSLARAHDSGKSSSNLEIHRSIPSNHNSSSPTKSDSSSSQPKPQPRVISSRLTTTTITKPSSPKNTAAPAQAKPPPKDLIDKIVLEIALEQPDPNCTIQDLSNCDISGIPETLDFDRCFQDVEMMTEEEARKLLSRKHDLCPATNNNKADSCQSKKESIPSVLENTAVDANTSQLDGEHPEGDISTASSSSSTSERTVEETSNVNININGAKNATSTTSFETSSNASKNKVRFSEEPVKVFDTYAVEDYDRGNDDIDPVAASAEYELEKSKEREGLLEVDTSEDEDNRQQEFNVCGAPQSDIAPPQKTPQTDHQDSCGGQQLYNTSNNDEEQAGHKEYVQSLEREVSLKRILEQNLRDLQSQYYEAVKELDDYKGVTETKLSELSQTISDLNGKLENSHNELADSRDQAVQAEKQLNEIKESSQTLEKKYHRAKKIIKDMQSREQSFNRREQLYQQKLDEIEYELGILIESVDRTVHSDGLKFFTVLDNTSTSGCQRLQHQARLDVIGFIRQMLNNFKSNQSTQNPQIKQRVVSILEQQIANLMIVTNGSTSIVGNVSTIPAKLALAKPIANDNSSQEVDSNKHSQSYQLASHRLSQPNLPHPIGVGGQPTKLFHGLNPVPIPVALNEPSPPQSVNSYPSTNSLNSLNNNNNNNNNNSINNNNNNVITATKLREQQPSISDLQMNMNLNMGPSSTVTSADDKFHPAPDIQVPYQTNEWHDKPVSEWTTTQVSTWLLALGLDQYISKFEDRNVNGQSLINLDSTVLKGLGVLNSNDRNLLKKKIRELRLEMEKERKQIEKKMKENLKDKSKNKLNGNNKTDVQNKSWKKSLLS